MSQDSLPADRTFSCESCGGEIRIPYDLPPTTAPCPLCGKETTSPPPPGLLAGTPAPGEALVPLTQVDSAADLHLDPLLDKAAVESPAPRPPAPARPAPVETPVPPVEAPVAAVDEPAPVTPESPGTVAAAETPPVDPRPAPDEAPAPPVELPGSVPPLDEDLASAPESGLRNINPVLPFVGVIALIVLLLVAAILMNRGRRPAGATPTARSAVERSRFLREGWRIASSERLKAFIEAETVEERAAHVLGGASRIPDMKKFYGDEALSESDTPLSAYSHFDLELADKERGIFMMRYERPAQFNMREFFRPVAPLPIQYRLEEPGLLLSSFASLENFAMEPVRVMAFFKLVGDDLLLDWDVYVQTKYRTLRDFSTYPQPGAVRTFRVIVNEDVPSVGQPDLAKFRHYRFADAAHSGDYVKLKVAVDSKEARIMESLNWIGLPGRGVPSQTATVVLAWTEGEDPRIELREILCWEFLGLGGTEGNAVPGVKYNPVPDRPEAAPKEDKAPGDDGAAAGGS